MNHTTKRLLAFILMLSMVVALLPTFTYAAENQSAEPKVDYITAEDDAIVEADIMNDIDRFFALSAKRSEKRTLTDYIEATDDIKALVIDSETFVEGSIVERGSGFFWQTTAGITCGYFPEDRYEADQMVATRAVNTSSLATWNYAEADSNDVCLVAPMYAEDSTFTDQYVKEAVAIAKALGGTAYGLIDSKANVTTIGQALEKCGVVIFDSHGGTDWQVFEGGSDGSGDADNTSQANTSYIWLSSGTGMTTADCAYVNGTYGRYPHAYKDSYGNYLSDGTGFANHMTNNSSGGLLWMAICLGMATDGMCAPLYKKGISVVYGYSQSVTFYGDYLYEETFWDNMLAGATVAEAASAMKSKHCSWDPYYDNYTISGAKGQYAAFPIFVSAQDTYPGQGNVDAIQTVRSTYTLFNSEPVTITLSTPDGTSKIEGTTNSTVSLPNISAPNGYTFAGWTTSPITFETTARPTIYKNSFVPSESLTLYALFTRSEEGSAGAAGEYTLYSGTITEGDYLIVYETGAMAAADADNSGRIDYQDVTITNDVISNPDQMLVWHIAPTADGNYSLYNAANSVYAAGTGTKSKACVEADLTTYSKWTVSGTSTYEFVNVGNKSSNVNANLRKNGTYGFACYSTSTGGALSLYAGNSATIYYTTTPAKCLHGSTTNVASVAATCTENGYTAGVYCNSCSLYISGHEAIPATGHTYMSVVTPPTTYEDGYTTYTCTSCGDSYTDDYVGALGETYTVSFVVPSGVAPIDDMSCGQYGITLPTAGVPVGEHTYTFVGWVQAQIDNQTSAPVILTDVYIAVQNTTLYALYTYCVGGSGSSSEFVLTDLSKILPTDQVVITVEHDGTVYALSSFNGSSSAPDAVTVHVSGNKLTSAPAQDLLWNISGSTNAYVISPDGNADIWLSCNNTNNGVRVNTNSNKTFKISSDYLYNNETGRYLGVYVTNPDWRCYTSTGGNIANQVLGFYAKGDSGTTFYTTVISAACSHTSTSEHTIEATCTQNGSISIICDDCGAVLDTQLIEMLEHNYIKTSEIAPNCTTSGSITYTCSLCGDSYKETTAATGHNYVGGICSICGENEPAEDDFCGRYYFAGMRNGDSFYQYIMGVLDGTRYDIVSSELTQLPTAITSPESDKIFVIEKNADGTYRIYAEGISDEAKYLGWTSGNSGTFVTADKALSLTIDKLDSGLYNIHFKGDAERYLSLNATPANTYAAWYKSGQIKDLALIPVQGESAEHSHNVIHFEGQPATCTEDGVIAYYYCASETCPNYGTCYADEELTIVIPETDLVDPATGHSYTYENNGEDHTVGCANCAYTANGDHAYINGECICGAIETTEPKLLYNSNLTLTMSIGVGAEMQVFYTVLNSKVRTFDSFYIEVVKNVAGGQPVKTIFSVADGNLDPFTNAAGSITRYMATYTGIAAKEMGDSFSATLYAVAADGTINYGPSETSSIKDYLMEQIDLATSSAELKTLAVDMLHYGAAAQINFAYDTANLVNSDLTAAQLALGTQEEPSAVNGFAQSASGCRVNTSVSIGSKVELYLTFIYKPTASSKMELRIKNTKGDVIETLTPEYTVGANYRAVYDNVGAKQMRDLITIELYDNGTLVSKSTTWSVETYVAQVIENSASAPELVNVCKAMLTYGDAAAVYLEASGQ